MHSHLFYPLFLGGIILSAVLVMADEPAIPGSGFAATRYEALWSKSPFSVASPDEGPESPDYSLVGIAQFDGISYATVINKQTQDHILVSSDKPVGGFTLISVTLGHDPSGTTAVLQKDGQSLTLKLEQAPVTGGANQPAMVNNAIPVNMPPMPGSQLLGPQGAFNGNQPGMPPQPFRRRDRIIHIPLPPGQAPMPVTVTPAQADQSGQPVPPGQTGQPPQTNHP